MTMIIAATGHRPNKLGGYGVGAKMKLRRLAHEYLERVKPDGVIVGMALGWDQAVGFAAVGLGIPVHAAVPFEGQESAWPPEAQQEYRSLIICCASRTVVFPGGYCAYAMQLRNEWMVERCNRVMAMWDGSPGGTANCIEYATKRGVPIDNLI
jgi:uncharacterized phage-like protein YoqJ